MTVHSTEALFFPAVLSGGIRWKQLVTVGASLEGLALEQGNQPAAHGGKCRLRWWSWSLGRVFPPRPSGSAAGVCFLEPEVLEEAEGDQGEHRMVMQA